MSANTLRFGTCFIMIPFNWYKGKERIKVFRRKIHFIRFLFALMCDSLSLVVVGMRTLGFMAFTLWNFNDWTSSSLMDFIRKVVLFCVYIFFLFGRMLGVCLMEKYHLKEFNV